MFVDDVVDVLVAVARAVVMRVILSSHESRRRAAPWLTLSPYNRRRHAASHLTLVALVHGMAAVRCLVAVSCCRLYCPSVDER